MTGRDLVTASLRLIGAIAPGDSLTASEAIDGLASVNRMIDSWSNDSLLIFDNIREEFSLTPGTQSYTIGSGGAFNTVRPLKIEEALIKVETTTPSVEYPVKIMSLSEWSSIFQKGISSNIPTAIYTEGSYPLDVINIYPMPSAACKLVLFSMKQLTSIATLDTSLSLPPGYERALVYNSAIELAPEYGKTPSELIFNTANESKAAIKRVNYKPGYLRSDAALVAGGRYNIYTGDYK